jgi:cobalt-zinc-cadmium efflux system outer membrane protein
MRRAYGAFILVCALGVSPGTAHAQQAPGMDATSPFIDVAGGLGLDEAIAKAREHEPSLQAVRHEVDVARGRREQSGSRPNPSTSFEMRGEPGGTDSLIAIGVEWPLDAFRRSGREATGDQRVAVSRLSVADRERTLAADVRAQYGRAVAAIREARVAAELAAAVERQAALMRARADQGAAPRLDSDLLEVELRRLQAERDLADGRAERAVLAIKPLLGMAAGEPLTLREPIEALVAARTAAPAAVTEASAAQRADVRMAAQQVTAAAAAVDQAESEGHVDVGVFGSYMRMDAGFPQLGVSPTGGLERVRGQFHYVSGGVRIMLPVLNRNQGEVAVARAEQAAAAARQQATELAARAEIASATVRERSARQALDAYGAETRDLARRNLDVVRQTFELGRATVYDVLAEQRRYLDFERAYTATLLEAWEAHVDLGRASGELK